MYSYRTLTHNFIPQNNYLGISSSFFGSSLLYSILGLCLCFGFCLCRSLGLGSRLSNTPTSKWQGQFSYNVFLGD
jgi:hypothetical protein